MVKKLNDSELDELRRLGSVEYDPEHREVARFGELIDKLSELISSTSERTAADLARSQVQLEVISSLQKMIRANVSKTHVSGETIDMEPLKEILREIHESNAERSALSYQFDIKRNGPGEHSPMAQVIATPIYPTKH